MTVAELGVDPPADPAGIAGAVRAGRCTATDVAETFLARIGSVRDSASDPFAGVDAERIRAEAAALDIRADRFALPLAGVPVAVEDGIDVSGRATRHGSAATARGPARRDDVLVRRLRAAGALIVGTSRSPELGLGHDGAPGGRATAAVLAEGLAALSVGVDGDGTLRAAAAAHGLLALTPGRRALPLPGGAARLWSGMASTTVLATDVDGARVAFEVLGTSRSAEGGAPGEAVPRQGGAPGWASAAAVTRPVSVPGGVDDLPVPRTVACSLRSGRGLWADPRACTAVHAAARRLGESDVAVAADDPPYRAWLPAQVSRRRDAGVARRVDELGIDPDLLGPDARAAVRRDRKLRRLGGPRPASPGRWRQRALALFDDGGYDVLLLPAPATGALPPACLGAWNLAGLPSLVAPVRWGTDRHPVQLVGRAGSERLLLGTAALLEER
ncbi:amidase family protein [Pseudonocardia sp. KRD291]|uniref:amidase family protein n=1 Tax=Pseudonocardia sp. KRD291 TaxID=2792007 RepID=UPI001C4A2004|nr:amidase family protein [Pseudonocardia sp. KRD291]MBW0102490.1 hypothetical protein [Pseudonocardia sp. KRD291]